MKNLLLALIFIPLLSFAAAPAKKVMGAQELWPAYEQRKQERYQAALRIAAAYVHKSPTGLFDNEGFQKLIARFHKQLMENEYYSGESTIWIDERNLPDFGGSIQGVIQHYYNNFSLRLFWDQLTDIPHIACVDVTDSLLQKLDLSNCPELNQASKERLRKAWATPTDIFPKGRNPNNLIFADKNDNKDQKS